MALGQDVSRQLTEARYFQAQIKSPGPSSLHSSDFRALSGWGRVLARDGWGIVSNRVRRRRGVP